MMDAKKVELPSVMVGGRTIQHNNATWRLCTNRHRNTDGSPWGWIEGAPGNVCWSDNQAFNSVAASQAVHEHNQWLEDQKPLVLRLIEACERQKSARIAYDRAKSAFEIATSHLEQVDQEVIRLSLEQARIGAPA